MQFLDDNCNWLAIGHVSGVISVFWAQSAECIASGAVFLAIPFLHSGEANILQLFSISFAAQVTQPTATPPCRHSCNALCTACNNKASQAEMQFKAQLKLNRAFHSKWVSLKVGGGWWAVGDEEYFRCYIHTYVHI